jgi:hypothetical protein
MGKIYNPEHSIIFMIKEKIDGKSYSRFDDGKPEPFKPHKVVLKLTPEFVDKNNREEIIDAVIGDLNQIMARTNDLSMLTREKAILDFQSEQLINVEGIYEMIEYAKEKGKFK